ncbi:GNAT family N-acetyltransferase [candidate division WOR-3 bacterium]|uniref:GNAT family N-acetyltransferase n=1 Tax=candidate division WOR-3 bacterium TaxID=2052148 RepID=A0A9D5K9H0_UNCW3|nr:GNAT family N-acetyltransferase [candidate division WOR-3 bacterium]MBD3364054.1 GNAT family N-acetyltransferase [candidate division WOR-3 bacterium]
MIRYTRSTRGISADKLNGFFEGWPKKPSPQRHLELLESSDEVIVAVDEESGDVAGFITAVTDHVLAAYIPFLEVLPRYRKKGIAGELLRRMLDKLKYLYMVDTVCDEEVIGFYKKSGFVKHTAMIYRNYTKQGG